MLSLRVFVTDEIPIGAAKAIKKALPPKKFGVDELHELLKQVKISLKQISRLPKDAHFRHHIFGRLNKKKALKFIKIHTLHHFKIIEEIIQAHQEQTLNFTHPTSP